MEITFTTKFKKFDASKVGVTEDVVEGLALEIIRKGYATNSKDKIIEVKVNEVVNVIPNKRGRKPNK